MNLRNALFSVAVAVSFVSTVVRGQDVPDLRIVMTGYLLGYYRAPDVQHDDFLGDCRSGGGAAGWAKASPAARDLRDRGEIPLKSESDAILVGMGDNFGVELYSRTFGVADPPKIVEDLHPKLRELGPAWQPSDDGKIGDNVGCFLSMAGYSAVVPGKEDLYFGPERLRRIAQRLNGIHVTHRVPMLASNLIQQTTYWKEPATIPDSQKNLNFTPGLPEYVQVVDFSDHGHILPFLRKITVRAKSGTDPEPYLCTAFLPNDPDKIVPEKSRIDQACAKLNNLDRLPGRGPNKDQDDLAYPIPRQLVADANYGLCFSPSSDESKPRCVRFNVDRPFFLSSSCLVDGTGTSKGCGAYETPYVFKQLSDSRQVVIFGVVDPDLVGLVGRDNLSWRNENQELHTEVAARDPLASLRQAVQLFEESEKDRIDPSKLRWILLAQMSRAKAEELASHFAADMAPTLNEPTPTQPEGTKPESLHFDVVIAAATDASRATSPRTISLDEEPPVLSKGGLRTMPLFRPVVIAPQWGLDAARKPINPVRELTLTDHFEGPGGARREFTLTADVSYLQRPPEADMIGSEEVEKLLNGYASTFLGIKLRDKTSSFVTATLKIMREATKADFAMLQKRDFYWGTFRRPHDPAGGDVAQVLWTGDVLRVITVTGATLKKVLQESAQFDQADLQVIQEVQEVKRGLVYYGLEATEGGNYLIDGALLDPARLYTIATSNHISAGDTGYPELNDLQFVDNKLPNSPALLKLASSPPKGQQAEGRQISEIVCLELRLSECVTLGDDREPFARSDQQAAKVRAGARARIRAWGFNSLNQPLFAKVEDRSSPELTAQDRPIWRFSLLQASFSFQESINNLSEKERAQLFTGFSAPGINGANSHQWQVSKQAEAVRSGKWLDEYVRNQMDYSSQVNEQIAPALPSVSQSKNRDQFDTGVFFSSIYDLS